MNGIIAGAIYALVASGFSLIYSVTKIMHFAHGATLALGAYVFYSLHTALGLPLVIAIIITLGFVSLFGEGMNRIIYKPLRRTKSSNSILLIASISLMNLITALILAFWGADVKSIFITNPVFDVLGARITLLQIIIIMVSLILLVLLWFLTTRTRLGISMRAVADNKEVAQSVGINPEYTYTITFLISSALAGMAGILIGLEQNLYPYMGLSLIIKAFTAAVIGSLTSVPGAILGSFMLGLIENIGIWWLPSGYKDAIAFVLLFVFLLFKPSGLLASKKREA